MTQVKGGYSQAKRGLVTLSEGRQVFAKFGVDDNTKAWAKKEIAVYRFLKAHGFTCIPELLAVSPDETAFALEALTPANGWDWTDTWTGQRLDATLKAMDDLAGIVPADVHWQFFSQKALDESHDGWGPLAKATDMRQKLLTMLREAGRQDVADGLHFNSMAATSAWFNFTHDTLVHNDIRADNCTWNAATGRVKLVDWSWTQLGDERIDTSALLVHVQRAGLSVLPAHAARLDAGALHWLAGFWFKSAVTPIWPGGPEDLRPSQLQSGITALELAAQI